MADTMNGPEIAQRGAQTAKRTITDELTDPESETVREATSRRCDQCLAAKGQLCVKRGGFKADLTGRVVHLGRLLPP